MSWLPEPATVNLEFVLTLRGSLVPIAVTPFPQTVNRVVVAREDIDEEAIVNTGVVLDTPDESWIDSLADGVVDPMPTFKSLMVRVDVPDTAVPVEA